MTCARPSLSFRTRYEGRVQTFDRRPRKETEAEFARARMRYMVARTLSPFRARWLAGSGAAIPRAK